MNTIYMLLLSMAIIYGGGAIVFVEWNRKFLKKYNTRLSTYSKEVDDYLTYNTDRSRTE